ncbi:PREDICTED: probable poly(ADP-ribose) glycohydrolase 2 isoform X2 [Tarenaya hassleriana]|uniref:probable poly(ADP-ribose) glycohydrolase 2 isoform X2 n=1 Tax=Tarenaya hassleriana TaxID=28532 RepID=UPI00053CA1C5|nr:PREDICTED: probable poly(ADP-ribose) glycohydrolase 2 isoform X2 [Tarenaya hassleriana]
MEKREDLMSILPYLPLGIQSSSLSWPFPHVVEVLEAMSKGPSHSRLDSGEALSDAISAMRQALSLTTPVSPSALQGYALFFDERMSREESNSWFDNTIPAMACLLLRFPSLLELHYLNSDNLIDGTQTGLRLLRPQEAGIVFLSQELIGALLTCSFFCLFPVTNRGSNRLPIINFDKLFGNLINTKKDEKQEHKIRCIVHYFERVSSGLPPGFVSFERKVLPFENHPVHVTYPDTDFWSKSTSTLCAVEVHNSGLIEDQRGEALEVDFANKYLGGGVLRKGCVQEEIRFMINPELIGGMLFLPAMDVNETIEIVGAERFSHYIGYSSSFRFIGDYIDTRERDIFGRRKTRITAIDALRRPGTSQYKSDCLLRETNKAFCGFLHFCKAQNIDDEDRVGVATGNWGCGAYGGDPELKSMLQWLAASEAKRPFMSYYTFGFESLHNLNQVIEWILSNEWTVGDLWNKLVEYSNQRLTRETKLGLFCWLIPTVSASSSTVR